MTIDQIDFSKLRSYSASKYQSFEMLWYLICKREYKDQGILTPIDDSGGGDGVEFYLTFENGDVWGWQCKYFARLDNSRKNQIKTSLKKALEVHGDTLKKWVLCSLSDFTPKEKQWFDKLSTEHTGTCLEHAGDSELLSYMCKYPEIENFFFGTNRLDDKWFSEHYDKVMSREDISKKYLSALHTKGQAQEEVYTYIGGPLLASLLEMRIERSEISVFSERFTASIDNLKIATSKSLPEFDSIKKNYIALIEPNESLLKDITTEVNVLIVALRGERHDIEVSEAINKIFALYKQVADCSQSLSEFLKSDTFSPLYWGKEDNCKDKIKKDEIINLRNVILEPHSALKESDGDLFLLLGDLKNYFQKEVHVKGAASKGKSHLALNLFEQYHTYSLPAVFLSGKDFSGTDNVESQITKLLDIDNHETFERFLSDLNLRGEVKGVKALLIIDGLNESIHWNILWKTGLNRIRALISSKGYTNLLLVTTYRTSYEEEIFDDFFSHGKNRNLTIEVQGFDYETINDVIKRYFAFYKITVRNTTSIRYVFRNNPLALRMFCESHQGQEVSLSRESLFHIFDEYLEHCNKRIKSALNKSVRYNREYLMNKLSDICDYLWEHSTNEIPIEKVGIDDNELVYIEGEDLLIYREWSKQEVVSFTYDLLAGYIISTRLLSRYTTKDKFLEAFDNSILPKLLGDDGRNQNPLSEDILSCLLVLSIKEYGLIYTEERYDSLSNRILKAIYDLDIDFIEEHRNTITQYLSKHLAETIENFKVANVVRFVEENPLNFHYTSELLKGMSVSKRDLVWTTVIMNEYRSRKMNPFIEFMKSSLTDTKKDNSKIHLEAEYFMWLLTTNCRKLRFQATEILFYYAKKYPCDFLNLLRFSLDINDIYVPERMLAVTYGVILNRINEVQDKDVREWIIEASKVVYESIYSSNRCLITTHYFVREYSRKIIETVNQLIPNTFSKTMLRPLYKKCGITKTQIRKWRKQEYCGGPLRMDFSNYTIGCLIPNGHSYSNPELKQRVRGYIYDRVLEFGWNEEKFREVEEMVDDSSGYSRFNNSSKIDRFGKKYSWIAYYEVAGILEDTGQLNDEYTIWRSVYIDIDPSFPCSASEADIKTDDYLYRTIPFEEWLTTDTRLPLEEIYVRESIPTIEDNGQFVCLYGYITANDKQSGRKRFTFIRPLIYHKEDKVKFLKFLMKEDLSRGSLSDERRNNECFAGEIALWDKSTESNWVEMEFRQKESEKSEVYANLCRILEDCIDKKTGRLNLNMIDDIWDDIDGGKFNVLIPTMTYSVEFDEAIPYQTTLAKEIIFSENLRFIPQTFRLQDEKGRLAFAAIRHWKGYDDVKEFSYIRKDVLDSFLKKNDLSMIWCVWGEKDRLEQPFTFTHFQQFDEYQE